MIRNLKHATFLALIEYIYTGQLFSAADNLPDLLMAADMYALDHLKASAPSTFNLLSVLFPILLLCFMLMCKYALDQSIMQGHLKGAKCLEVKGRFHLRAHVNHT